MYAHSTASLSTIRFIQLATLYAQERQESQFRAPKQRVKNFEELYECRGRKRKEFEKRIRQAWGNIVQLWLSYPEVELKSCNIQHARNLFDRVVTFPRVNQLWYKYVDLEELLGNVLGVRQVFEHWMQRELDDKAWQVYIKLEQRYDEQDRASAIFERWVAARLEPRIWAKWGKFEEERGSLDKAREVFQTAFEFLSAEEQIKKAQAVFIAFAKMETQLKEYERARVIYKFALSRLPRSKSVALCATYTKFEMQHRMRSTLESTVLGKRRIRYKEELSHDGRNHDVWFDYARLEEGALRNLREEGSTGEEERATNRVHEAYERAVAQLYYTLFEEIEIK
ncbi:Pre-mRNA-splicing factor CLF1, partial [Trametes pubescens]